METLIDSSQVGSVVRVANNPGFQFEIHIISYSSDTITSELQIIAVRQLNGVTVECGPNLMYIIQVASIGESITITSHTSCQPLIDTKLKTLQLHQVES